MIISFSLFLGLYMDKKLVFYSILDFFPRRDEIKEIYKSLCFNDKKYYKKYVYSMCFEREFVKDLIWEFLNDWEESYEKLEHEFYVKRRKAKNAIIENNINNIDTDSTGD